MVLKSLCLTVRRSFVCLLLLALLLQPIAAHAAVFTPGHAYCDKPDCFWEMPMDVSDTEAVWAMLTAPMTVVKGNYRNQVYLYAEPDEDSSPVADVTCATQGLHVLDSFDDGWSLVETYSSSFSGSRVKAWNKLVQGYIRTDKLEEVQVDQDYAMIVDKLEQRLYLYYRGELLDVLLVSTGYAAEDKPFNETRSGEFLLYSRTGEFPSGNLFCSFGLRFNDGDLLHEVPHKKVLDEFGMDTGEKAFYHTEPYLGEKASHGCIRVQRLETDNGINMEWIWDNLYSHIGNVRMVIWEDWPGRTLNYPDSDLALFYNPRGGSNYHATATCSSVSARYLPLSAFTYGELEDEPYNELKRCPHCMPVLRMAEIDEINWKNLE